MEPAVGADRCREEAPFSPDTAKLSALTVLENALRNKSPSSWKVYELRTYLELRGEKDVAKAESKALVAR